MSIGSIVARQIGSLVSLTMRRLSTSSAVRRVASACVSVWRRVAASAWAEMMSIGASVPTSTRTRLSSMSFSASESDCFAASMARIAASRSQYAFLVVAVSVRDPGPQRDVRHLARDRAGHQLVAGVVDLEVPEQRLGQRGRQLRRELRIQRGEGARRVRSRVVERRRVARAEPGQGLRDVDVRVGDLVGDPAAAVQQAGRQRHASSWRSPWNPASAGRRRGVWAIDRSCNWGLSRSTDSSMLFSSAILTAWSTVSWITGRASARSSSVFCWGWRRLRLALRVLLPGVLHQFVDASLLACGSRRAGLRLGERAGGNRAAVHDTQYECRLSQSSSRNSSLVRGLSCRGYLARLAADLPAFLFPAFVQRVHLRPLVDGQNLVHPVDHQRARSSPVRRASARPGRPSS